MKENSNEMYFVEIKDSANVRREVLESLRDIIGILQRFEQFKHIKHEKYEQIQKLRLLMRQANKLMGNMKSYLPAANFKAPAETKPEPAPKPSKKGKKKGKEKKPAHKPMTELDRLQAELGAIEGKLRQLS